MIDTSDTDTEGNFSAINKITDNLHYTVDGIRKEMSVQFQQAITIMTEKFVELIERNNNILRNEIMNMPSTSAVARQQNKPVVNDLLLDTFPTIQAPAAHLNFPPPLQPIAPVQIPRPQPRQRQQQVQPKIKATFAAVLTRSKEKPESIRNVRTTGTDEQRAETMAELQRENACMNNKIKAIKSKGNFNLTIKCDTPECDGPKIEINEVQKIKPQVKITGVLCNEAIDHNELIQSIKTQNHWLRGSEFKIDRVYSIGTKKGPYSNIIITCDINLQRRFIDQQYVIIGSVSARSTNTYTYFSVCAATVSGISRMSFRRNMSNMY